MTNSTLSKNVMVGCAFNYTTQDILPFLNSLQACSYSDDLILLTNNQSNINLNGYSFNGIIINIDKDFRHSKKKTLEHNAIKENGNEDVQHQRLITRTLARLKKDQNLSKPMAAFFYNTYFMMTSRFFLYYYYLLETDYTNVFLTDVNDVFFQRNPFERQYKNGVTAFAEQDGISIEQEATNRFWILETFGEEVLQKMADKIVYCGGTIMLTNCTNKFLKDFLSIVINHKVSTWIQGVDQGVFNYMLSYLKLNYFNSERNGNIVLTVANVPELDIVLNEKGMLLKGSTTIPDVVHQYTRFENQKQYVVEKYQQQ